MSFALTSCSVGEEPERIYAVAAVGFDAIGDNIRISVEVPLVRETDAKEELKTAVFSGEGGNVQEALRHLTSGLSKRLVFSHCALMVLGENLSRARLTEAFAFADTGIYLPLAAKVVSTPNARELLKAGSLSAPAVGYEIGEILEREFALIGMDPPCKIYELRANARGGDPVALPYFEAGDPSTGHACSFEGMNILIADAPSLRIDREACVFYAILSDFFVGGNGQAGGYGMGKVSDLQREVSMDMTDTGGVLTLRLFLKTDFGMTDEERQTLSQFLRDGCQEIYAELQREKRGDLCGFSKQLGREIGGAFSYETTELRVVCELVKERSGIP
jgi:hypothetical protein